MKESDIFTQFRWSYDVDLHPFTRPLLPRSLAHLAIPEKQRRREGRKEEGMVGRKDGKVIMWRRKK